MLVVPVVVVIKQLVERVAVLLGKNIKMVMIQITRVVPVLVDALDALVFAVIVVDQHALGVIVFVVMFVHLFVLQHVMISVKLLVKLFVVAHVGQFVPMVFLLVLLVLAYVVRYVQRIVLVNV